MKYALDLLTTKEDLAQLIEAVKEHKFTLEAKKYRFENKLSYAIEKQVEKTLKKETQEDIASFTKKLQTITNPDEKTIYDLQICRLKLHLHKLTMDEEKYSVRAILLMQAEIIVSDKAIDEMDDFLKILGAYKITKKREVGSRSQTTKKTLNLHT